MPKTFNSKLRISKLRNSILRRQLARQTHLYIGACLETGSVLGSFIETY
jgi:hypothetical protein